MENQKYMKLREYAKNHNIDRRKSKRKTIEIIKLLEDNN